MTLRGLAAVILTAAFIALALIVRPAEGAPPQPHNFYGIAREADGTTPVGFGSRITTFIDGVDYSNGTSVYNAAGAYDLDVSGDNHTDLFTDGSPEVKDGGDIADEIMFVRGEMASTGDVFTAKDL